MELKQILAELNAVKDIMNHCEQEVSVLTKMIADMMGVSDVGVDAPISSLDLPTRAKRVLRSYGAKTIGDVTLLTFVQMKNLKGSGLKTASDTEKALKRVGLQFAV